ncbi:hypothetical protein [Nitrosopumilus sp.]|uniref:hypothetical protein n=1 Tax=Nitrosopumilus sp. TaxID=2024843 RepID=UPI00262D462A|nr:hypothetical protein [Nitrosopumilus sp.]
MEGDSQITPFSKDLGGIPMKKNQWIMQKNQHSGRIKQFLKFSKCETLDELTNLNPAKIELLLNEYVESLQDKNTECTIIQKVDSVVMFFSVNEMFIFNELTSEYFRDMKYYENDGDEENTEEY